jgi:hypothetical protein
MPTAPPPGLTYVKVLITDEQKGEINAITKARRTPENRLKQSTVIREALKTGLEAQRQQHIEAQTFTESQSQGDN